MTAHPFRLALEYAHAGHPLLAPVAAHPTTQPPHGLTLTLSKAGAALPRHGNPGHYHYLVEGDGAGDYVLRVVVGPPPQYTDRHGRLHAAFSRDLLTFEQPFTVDSSGRLVPGTSDACPFTQWHPRVRPGPTHGTRTSGGGTDAAHARGATLVVDLTFLDVTAYYEETRFDSIVRNFFQPRDDHGRVRELQDSEVLRLSTEHFGGCKLRIVQCTASPGVWCVLVPPAIADGDASASAILFFGPSGPGYSSIDNADFLSASRYLTTKADGTDWGVFGRVEDLPLRQYIVPVDAARGPLPLADIGTIAYLNAAFPSSRFDSILAASGKKSIFVFPIANGSSYGASAGPSARALVTSLLRTLWGDGQIAATQRQAFDLDKFVVSGFSFGGGVAFDAFRANRNHVDELWLLDPNDFSTMKPTLRAWLDGNSSRKLRLIGGLLTNDMHAAASRVLAEAGSRGHHRVPSSPGRSTVWPGHRSFFSHAHARGRAFWIADRSSDGATLTPRRAELTTVSASDLRERTAAVARARRGEGAPSENLIDAPSGSLSAETGVFLVERERDEDDDVRIVGQLENGTFTSVARFPNHHPDEVAFYVHAKFTDPDDPAHHRRIQGAAFWRAFVASVLHLRLTNLHQWPVNGAQAVGDGDDDDAEQTTPYFELCLRFSQIPGSSDGGGGQAPRS